MSNQHFILRRTQPNTFFFFVGPHERPSHKNTCAKPIGNVTQLQAECYII